MINQSIKFFGCQNIVGVITSTNDIRSKEFYYGYENGDLTKKVELRLTGVLSKFVPTSDIRLLTQGENITVRNVGEKYLIHYKIKQRKKYLLIHGFITHLQDLQLKIYLVLILSYLQEILINQV